MQALLEITKEWEKDSNPQATHLLSNVGSLYAGRSDNQATRQYFRRAIAAGPAFPNTTYSLAFFTPLLTVSF
ncbi:MAG TPA: hypothetical protein VF177_14370 [Anaerolineae bacterium]